MKLNRTQSYLEAKYNRPLTSDEKAEAAFAAMVTKGGNKKKAKAAIKAVDALQK